MRQTSQGALTGITREDIERDASREAIMNSPHASRLLSEDEMQRSLDAMLADWNGRDDVFVFGYGSLIWNPCMQHSGRLVGTVRGYHRRFCLWSNVYRGTPENPGLVLGLDLGGAVRGILFRLDASIARSELELLWRREMFGGSYVARWLKAHTEEGVVNAIGFVINHQSAAYAGKLSDREVVEKLATSSGRYGSGADYLAQTAAALRAAGIEDRHLDQLCDLLAARHFEPDCGPIPCG
ncbi:MAG: gamma-glutamylcyclotransferase [Burkholderiales bacterium]|nr:MAG: gamma-glutamylcyclotransferase [Burkholderiales bacterium]TAG80941.1 MAG: gamma-glutamylcyclotransferase [Betaproteobacteria bacterium]